MSLSPAQWVELVMVGAAVVTAVFVTVLGIKTWRGDRFLCDDCKYNSPEACVKPERPQARDCTAYRRR